MSNEEFLNRLETALRDRVPREDVDDAMNYHREYFSEAGENAAEELPAPEAVAEQIVREREEYLRKGTRKVWGQARCHRCVVRWNRRYGVRGLGYEELLPQCMGKRLW